MCCLISISQEHVWLSIISSKSQARNCLTWEVKSVPFPPALAAWSEDKLSLAGFSLIPQSHWTCASPRKGPPPPESAYSLLLAPHRENLDCKCMPSPVIKPRILCPRNKKAKALPVDFVTILNLPNVSTPGKSGSPAGTHLLYFWCDTPLFIFAHFSHRVPERKSGI